MANFWNINPLSADQQNYWNSQMKFGGWNGYNNINDWLNKWNSFADPTQAFSWANGTKNGASQIANIWRMAHPVQPGQSSNLGTDNPDLARWVQFASDGGNQFNTNLNQADFNQYWGLNPNGAKPGATPGAGATWDPSIGGWRNADGSAQTHTDPTSGWVGGAAGSPNLTPQAPLPSQGQLGLSMDTRSAPGSMNPFGNSQVNVGLPTTNNSNTGGSIFRQQTPFQAAYGGGRMTTGMGLQTNPLQFQRQ